MESVPTVSRAGSASMSAGTSPVFSSVLPVPRAPDRRAAAADLRAKRPRDVSTTTKNTTLGDHWKVKHSTHRQGRTFGQRGEVILHQLTDPVLVV